MRDVLGKFQKKHRGSTLILLDENGRVLNGENFVLECKAIYTLIRKRNHKNNVLLWKTHKSANNIILAVSSGVFI